MSQEIFEHMESRAESVRLKRNIMLSNSDWTHSVTDRPIPNKEAWANYRQELRDLPLHPNFPRLAPEDWPTPPE
jgi:hypothetical protein